MNPRSCCRTPLSRLRAVVQDKRTKRNPDSRDGMSESETYRISLRSPHTPQPSLRSMHPENAVDGPNLRRLDEPGVGHRDGMQHAFEGGLPKIEESLQFGEVRPDVIGLPNIGLQ